MPVHANDSFENPTLAVARQILDVGMEVNCYVLKCKTTGDGAIIDAGGGARQILDLVDRMGIRVNHILLTHGHGDHVGALREVEEATGGRVCCCERDFSLLGGLKQLVAETVNEGWETEVGALRIEAVSLPGHTSGGIGYGTEGVFFSGDALFAGSLGGAQGSAYTGQIEAVRNKVLSREENIWIFPGHGPITTVEEERAHNLFYDSKLAEQRLSENLSVEDEDMQLRNFFTTGKLSWNPRFHNPHLDKWLHRIKIPTMIIWGDSDKIFPPAYGEAYKTAIPGSQLLIIPNCGHVPHQEKLAEFLAGIDTFTNGAK